MEWLAEFFDKIIQNQVLQTILHHFHWVDWVTLGFGFALLIYGIQQGVLRMIVEVAEFFFTAWVVFTFREKAAIEAHRYLAFIPLKFLPITVFIALFVIIFIPVLLVDGQLRKLFHTSLVGPVRIFGGAVLGGFLGVFMWSFFSQVLVVLPAPKILKNYDKQVSVTGPFIRNFAPDLCFRVKQ